MKRKEHFIGRIVKTVAFMGLAAALAGVWHNAAGIQAAGKTYPIVVPVATSPVNISDPNATAAPTSAPSYGPSEQYKLLNIKTSGNFDYVVVDETNRYASIVKIRNYGEDVVIPETVDSISDYAFSDDTELLVREDSYAYVWSQAHSRKYRCIE